MSKLGEFYTKTYNLVCGSHPSPKLWHFQWLAGKDLYSDLRELLPTLEGRVLDVGCGDKPYGVWLNSEKAKHIGIDVYPGSQVDFTIKPGDSWSFENSYFDAVICTQVLEHVANLNETIHEINRVLKPGGLLLVTVPFMYNQHGAPDDYRRLSIYGIRNLFERHYNIIQVKPQGGTGSTIGILLLNWVEMNMNLYKLTRILKAILLPFWIFFSLLINIIGWLFDEIDTTQSFYGNTLLLAKKSCD